MAEPPAVQSMSYAYMFVKSAIVPPVYYVQTLDKPTEAAMIPLRHGEEW